MNLTEQWKQADTNLKEAKALELKLRKKLSLELFGEYPTEGTHEKDGIKLTQKFNKKIVDLDGLTEYKPQAINMKVSLVAKEYDTGMDQFLEFKPSVPSLKEV